MSDEYPLCCENAQFAVIVEERTDRMKIYRSFDVSLSPKKAQLTAHFSAIIAPKSYSCGEYAPEHRACQMRTTFLRIIPILGHFQENVLT